MKSKYYRTYFVLSIITILFSSCEIDNELVQDAGFFQVEPKDYNKIISDTIIVNINEKLTFNFTNGNTDQILFYSGESGKEYRFADRSLYKTGDAVSFESKVTVATSVNNFVSGIATDFTLKALKGLTNFSGTDIAAATKTDLLKLRSTSTSASQVIDSYVLNASSVPLDMFVGEIGLAIVAKSADATKNMLSITAAGVTVTNTEVRNYGFSKNGIVVTNQKTLTYPVITNVLSAGAWAYYCPEKTIPPASLAEVQNAMGYAWNVGETGVNYAPTVTGGAVAPNANGIVPAISYPLSVTAPADPGKIVDVNSKPYESWLLSRIFNPLTVKPDAATIIKRTDQSSLLNYQYIYKERGVYKATFVGFNTGMKNSSMKVFEFVILVKNPTDNL